MTKYDPGIKKNIEKLFIIRDVTIAHNPNII